MAGFVDHYPAVLVYDADDPAQRVKYFVLLRWAGGRIVAVRDFVFARYAIEGARLRICGQRLRFYAIKLQSRIKAASEVTWTGSTKSF
jgi:hypothetical protein